MEFMEIMVSVIAIDSSLTGHILAFIRLLHTITTKQTKSSLLHLFKDCF